VNLKILFTLDVTRNTLLAEAISLGFATSHKVETTPDVKKGEGAGLNKRCALEEIYH
jgi:hypothetical protein